MRFLSFRHHGDGSVCSKDSTSTGAISLCSSKKSSSSSSKKPSSSSKKSSSSKDSAKGTRKSKKSANIKAVETFLGNMNHFTTMEAFLAPFASKHVQVTPEDFPPCSSEMLAHFAEAVHKSFPDIQFQFKIVKESPADPDTIVVEGFYCTGTHTGAPFFLPGAPAIPATGVEVKNDEESWYIHLVNGKIDSVDLISYGMLTGAAGLYEQIGGDLACILKK